ncbi:Nuclear valosin-containing protein [Galdieria sulphuraria]|uniref:AAA-type ATPase n=1 Tax=Galdieria sulphuraria TaxID=130081 RepID=M2W498_GALSU|nr:AAA-type ATPase [Galdieria sulphuraria]EME30581.1 AAA-type ATPase [Galdieria sulphuraria]GJD08976.1 Nuclear valosin-containing protein [Galdieria sulphuraria]|eukprot:XP_005707101.1 AAA-type ATPase [Galdieria sulphuraria]
MASLTVRGVIEQRLGQIVESTSQKIVTELELLKLIDAVEANVIGFARKTNRAKRLLVEKMLSSLGYKIGTRIESEQHSNEGRNDGLCPHFAYPYKGKQVELPYQPLDTKRRKCIEKNKPNSNNFTKSLLIEYPRKSFEDFGGIELLESVLRELVEWPLRQPELYRRLGVDPPKGVLIHGPSGCGKTLLAQVLAGEYGVPLVRVSAPEIVGGLSGESEERLRLLFEESKQLAPCILFIDEVDAISSKRESASKDMERRIVAQFLSCMDTLSSTDFSVYPVIILGATSRPDTLDPSLRRAGRFDRELELGAPNERGRDQILRSLCRNLSVDSQLDYSYISKRTAGYVGADLASLITTAATAAVARFQRDSIVNCDYSMDDNFVPISDVKFETILIKLEDFEVALEKTQPSALREGFTTVPDTSWSDIGSLDNIREELEMSVLEPIHHPERFEALGLSRPAGVLLYGPPGCGKTLLAKAIARESGANFISIKGPELLNKYVGESERAVRRVFQRGRASAPCIIFFDELDALAPRRGGFASYTDSESFGSSSGASERVVNQLLTELDGVEARSQVFVIAATNRPDMIDPAMLRPGRLDKLLFVPLPDKYGRKAILETLTRKMPLADDVSLENIAFHVHTEGFSGADLSALVREAATESLRSTGVDETFLQVKAEHFEKALKKVRPSVSSRDASIYQHMKGSFS